MMFIIWKGRGILIVPILFVGLLFGLAIDTTWAVALGLGMACVAIWHLGKKWNDDSNGRIVIDEQTGRRILLKKTHSLFFIPMQYWGLILGGVTVLLWIMSLFERG